MREGCETSDTNFFPHPSSIRHLSIHTNIHNKAASYKEARNIRAIFGHNAAVPHYKSLLQTNLPPNRNEEDLGFTNGNDVTAASRIAVSHSSPQRHDSIFSSSEKNDAQQLRAVLHRSEFTNNGVKRVFGIAREKFTGCGPLFVQPAISGSSFPDTLLQGGDAENQETDASLRCLVALFLLGFSLPKSTLVSRLVGGKSTVALLQRLGMLHPCEIDPDLLIPYVQLFPMDVNVLEERREENIEAQPVENIKSLVLATDWHPNVLSMTNLGNGDDGAVMYIGPDSLALVQNLSPLLNKLATAKQNKALDILDFCSGSGVQAITTLAALSKVFPNARATCVDVNPRALKFIRFNAILNGFDETDERIRLIHGNLDSGNLLSSDGDTKTLLEALKQPDNTSNNIERRQQDRSYQIILANPPFIPVPPSTPTVSSCTTDKTSLELANLRSGSTLSTSEIIQKRFGLFSAGGSNGELILSKIITLSSALLCPNTAGSFLGIVSEFMNPGTELLHRMDAWWDTELEEYRIPKERALANTAKLRIKGSLLTNEHALSGDQYAERRSHNDREEYQVWKHHLDELNITAVSPGLLFASAPISQDNGRKKNAMDESNHSRDIITPPFRISHWMVPKTKSGSIWTPHNRDAIQFITDKLKS